MVSGPREETGFVTVERCRHSAWSGVSCTDTQSVSELCALEQVTSPSLCVFLTWKVELMIQPCLRDAPCSHQGPCGVRGLSWAFRGFSSLPGLYPLEASHPLSQL